TINHASLLDLRVANVAVLAATTDSTQLISDGKVGVEVDPIGEYTRLTGPVIGATALVEVAESTVAIAGTVTLPGTTSIGSVS
ncbi:hypothetical protein IAI19_11725, partial [Streptococcus pseudopneumoniae]|uniref:hypothetical protein n=1 Tax=Streptococcus pseudopneumoniae TaxID=257758 RepID=UPI0018B0AFD9